MQKVFDAVIPASRVFGEEARSFNREEIDRVLGKSEVSMERGKGKSAQDNSGHGFR